MSIKVRLIRKLAQVINGIDLSRARAGEEIELSARDAEVLIAEGWAALSDRSDGEPVRRKKTPKGAALN